MAQMEAPIPLSEIEGVLAWVDTFTLSRPTKKINRDFSDGVLLAEILNVHYPKLVEMHNYPPRNSHSLKLNNWMTLNRKVLKKLRLSLCCNTMEQLANSTPGVIERVLVMVRDKIRRDEEANKSSKEEGANMSSGGSYYEACGDDEHILVVPVKTRVNGVLETLQQKVVSYDSYCVMKQELKDARDAAEVLKQKVDHLDNLIKLKDERIVELQNQLERKQNRRKELETQQNILPVPYDIVPSPHIPVDIFPNPVRTASLKTLESKSLVDEAKVIFEESKAPKTSDSKIRIDELLKPKISDSKLKVVDSKSRIEESRIPVAKDSLKSIPKIAPPENLISGDVIINYETNDVKSDIFKEIEVEDKFELSPDEEFKDSVGDQVMTIEETIQQELKEITKKASVHDMNKNNFVMEVVP